MLNSRNLFLATLISAGLAVGMLTSAEAKGHGGFKGGKGNFGNSSWEDGINSHGNGKGPLSGHVEDHGQGKWKNGHADIDGNGPFQLHGNQNGMKHGGRGHGNQLAGLADDDDCLGGIGGGNRGKNKFGGGGKGKFGSGCGMEQGPNLGRGCGGMGRGRGHGRGHKRRFAGGFFPGGGATNGIFPGGGNTNGIFPGHGNGVSTPRM